MNQLSFIDIALISLYLIGIIVAGLWYSRRKRDSSEGYFLAGKTLSWPVIGASLFASNISTVHLVGLAESGFIDGIVWGNYEWFSALELLILAFLFIPFYLRTKITTLPEFLEKRYDHRSRIALAIFSILAALFMHIGVSFYAGAVVFEKVFGIDIFLSIVIIGIATGIYTIVGGLTSVVVTETIQTIILIFGSLTITIMAILALPDVGIYSLVDLKEVVSVDRFKAVAFDTNAKGFTFPDILFSHLILGIWYWCTDQTIVQRVLGAKSENEAKLGAVFAGFLKILPVFIMVVPGILAYALFRDEIGEDSKSVLPVMIMNLLPMGLKGLMVAALLAAVMSSVAAALNSSSTLLVFDVFKRLKPDLAEGTMIKIGRFSAVIVLVLAVLWSPFLGNLGGIFELINQMFSIFAPSIVTVFLYGILSPRGTAKGAFITLLLGSVFAALVFITEKYVLVMGIENYISNEKGLGINWLRQTVMFFLVSSTIYWSVSLSDKTKPKLSDTFYLNVEKSSLKLKLLSAALVIIMLSIYLFFY